MSTAALIREFVNKRYVEPARAGGTKQVVIRAGDVHSEMKLKDRMPAIASALGASIFEKTYNVRKVASEGPHNGANLKFTFEI